MFDFIKKIFKIKKNYVIIKLDDQLFENKKIISWKDFYEKTGIMEQIEKLIKVSEFKKYHYKNVQANDKTIQKCYDLIKHNLTKTKNKYSRIYKEKVLLTMAAHDYLQFSPFTNEKLNDNEIRITLPASFDFVKVKKEDL